MTKARRLRIYLACNGRCICGVKVPMEGTTIDHPTQLWMGGPDEDQYLRYMCEACDKPKTARDAKDRAKVKRIIRKADPATRKPPKMRSRPFPKGSRPCYAASLKGVSRPVSDVCKERGIAAAAVARKARTHCKRNHPLAGDNLFLTSSGGRGCKACRRVHKATHRSKANG